MAKQNAYSGLNDAAARFVDDITREWTLARFLLTRRPLYVGSISNGVLNQRPKEIGDVTDMLVKLRHQDKLTLPPPYSDNPYIRDFLGRALDFERNINPEWKTSYMYFTLRIQTPDVGRSPACLWNDLDTCGRGPHIDGMQGNNVRPKLHACHTYMVVDRICPVFYTQGFEVTGFDPDRQNINLLLAQQLSPSATYTPAPNDIIVYSAYQLHMFPKAYTASSQLQLRLDVSHKQFNNISAAINPQLPPDWRTWTSHSVPTPLKAKATFEEVKRFCHCGNAIEYNTAFDCWACGTTATRYNRHTCTRSTRSSLQASEYNTGLLNWAKEHQPRVNFVDFKFKMARTNYSYTDASIVEFYFLSESRQRFLRCAVPIDLLERMRSSGRTQQLAFNVTKLD